MIKSTTVTAIRIGDLQPLGQEQVLSGIFKQPVRQAMLTTIGFQGDHQGDTLHHGGPEKAVHHYPTSHYPFWQQQLNRQTDGDLIGSFGENLSTAHLSEQDVCIGDVWQLDQAIVEVSQPRQPCWRLNARFARPHMARLVQESRRTGWYYRVLTPGMVAAGFPMILLERPNPNWTIAHLLEILYGTAGHPDALREMAVLHALSESYRTLAKQRLKTGQIEDWCKRLGEQTSIED